MFWHKVKVKDTKQSKSVIHITFNTCKNKNDLWTPEGN